MLVFLAKIDLSMIHLKEEMKTTIPLYFTIETYEVDIAITQVSTQESLLNHTINSWLYGIKNQLE